MLITDLKMSNETKENRRLLNKSEIDPYLWLNKFIFSGYRPPDLSNFHYIKRFFYAFLFP